MRQRMVWVCHEVLSIITTLDTVRNRIWIQWTLPHLENWSAQCFLDSELGDWGQGINDDKMRRNFECSWLVSALFTTQPFTTYVYECQRWCTFAPKQRKYFMQDVSINENDKKKVFCISSHKHIFSSLELPYDYYEGRLHHFQWENSNAKLLFCFSSPEQSIITNALLRWAHDTLLF